MATWDRYRAIGGPTGLELFSYTGQIANFRSYCDDPDLGPVGIYIAKAPVCKLKMTPVVQLVNTNIAWDISQSMSATSSIETFDIDWGGPTNIGDLPGQDWVLDPKTGNVQYMAQGKYTVVASVTDLLGKKSKEVKLEINIVKIEEYVYIGATGLTNPGAYLIAAAAAIAQKNTGLTGNHPNFRAIHVHPATMELVPSQHHVWACTQDGLAYSVDGMANWSVIAKAALGDPENLANDDPAPVTADLDQIDLCFDPQDPQRVYVLRRTTAPRVWLYRTNDYGATWTNNQVGV